MRHDLVLRNTTARAMRRAVFSADGEVLVSPFLVLDSPEMRFELDLGSECRGSPSSEQQKQQQQLESKRARLIGAPE